MNPVKDSLTRLLFLLLFLLVITDEAEGGLNNITIEFTMAPEGENDQAENNSPGATRSKTSLLDFSFLFFSFLFFSFLFWILPTTFPATFYFSTILILR